jgi:hypothetical protein
MGYANRHEVEEYMAELANRGCIVELGGGYGRGAQALAHGTRRGANLPIYIVDPYEEYKDLLGGEYGPSTFAEFEKNTEGLDVIHVPLRAEDAAKTWSEPVGFLWIDLTMNYERLRAIFNAWKPHLAAGSYIGITGFEYGNLGTRLLAKDIHGLGYDPVLVDQNKVACFHKTKNSRAVFYIVSGDDDGRYVREAQRSAKSVKEHLKLPTHLFLSGKVKDDLSIFTHVHTLPSRSAKFWYLDSTRFFVQAVKELAEYDQLLYLDVDTYICCPCLDLFQVLDQYDLAMGQSPQRDAIASMVGAPPAFTTMSIGVNAFRNTQRVRDFLAGWLARYEKHADFYDDNDQAPLRDELYENALIRWLTLPPEYNLRFDFGAWVVGQVRILHGRIGGISTDRVDPQAVCDEINSHRRMRVWNHGLLKGDNNA